MLTETLSNSKGQIGTQKIWLASDGRFRVEQKLGEETRTYFYDGRKHWRMADGKPKLVTRTQAKLNSAISQAAVLLASNQKIPFEQFGKLSLDGSGKASGSAAYRFKLIDDNNDWYYFWLSMYGPEGDQKIRLVKGCCERDADDNSGAWTLKQWSNEKHWLIPKQRMLVDNLEEKMRMTVKTTSVETSTKIDASLFTAPTAETEKDNR